MLAALAEVDDVALMLQRDLTAPEGAAFSRALEFASGVIRRWCRQTISYVEDDEVVLRGVYGRELILPERPVVDVTSIGIGGLTIATGSYQLVGESVWYGASPLNIANLAEFDGGGWGSPATNVAVTYSHGFREVPADVVGVCVGMVQRYAAVPSGVLVGSETIGSYSYTLSSSAPPNAWTLTDDDRAVLAPYRRTWFQ